MYKKTINLLTRLAFISTSVVFILIIGAHLWDQLWNDEIYSLVHFVFKPLKSTLTDYHSTNNHIFFNLVNSLFLRASGITSLNTLLQYPYLIRILSLIYCLITCIFVYRTAKILFTEKVAILSLAVLFTTIAFTNQALQARGYSLSLMFCSILFYYNVVQLQKPSQIQFVFLFFLTALLLYTMLSNLWFVLAAASIALLQKQWRIVAAYAGGVLFALILYSPVLGSIANNDTIKSQGKFPLEIFWLYMPKLFYYFLAHRYLLPIFIILAIYKLFPKYKKQILLVFCFFILPFIFSFLKMQIPPDRVFLFLIPVFSVFTAFCIQYLLSLTGKRESFLFFMVLIYLNITNLFAAHEINNALTSNIKLGIRKQNLMYNYYLCKYNPREIATFCSDKSSILLFDTEPNDLIYYLKSCNIKSLSFSNANSLLDANKTIWCITRFPNQEKDLLQKILPNAVIVQEPLPIGYYAVFKCQNQLVERGN